MNWCGCSNYFMTGYYNRVGPFLCASEKAAIAVAVKAFSTLEERLGPTFAHHVSGTPHFNSIANRNGGNPDEHPASTTSRPLVRLTQPNLTNDQSKTDNY